MTAASPPLVLGEARLLASGHVAGWCWRGDAGEGAAVVEILVDGTPVAAMAATLPSGYLGVTGDRAGRNGFVVPLPPGAPIATAQRVEARERATGHLFARILLRPELTRLALEARLAALSMRDIEVALRPARAPDADARLRGAMAGLAPKLRGEAPEVTALRSLRARMPRLSLSSAPDISLVLPTREPDQARRMLVAVQPICDHLAAEILLVEEGGGVASLLAQIEPALRVIHPPRGTAEPALLDVALAEARGRVFCLCAAAASGNMEWPEHSGLHLGGEAVFRAPRGARLVAAPHCFELVAPVAVLRAAGGFAAALEHAASTERSRAACCVAVAEAASLLGVAVTAWRAPG